MSDLDALVDLGGIEDMQVLTEASIDNNVADQADGMLPTTSDADIILSKGETDVGIQDCLLAPESADHSDVHISPSQPWNGTHSVSFGTRLDRDAYDELMRQRDDASWTLKTTNNDAEFLEAYKRKEEAQSAMDDMKMNSDEYKYYEESEKRKFDAAIGRINNTLSNLRNNGIDVPLI